jgi:putative CocE/NonD family hydrolase
MCRPRAVLTLAALSFAAALVSAQLPPSGSAVASRYTKREVLVPMRDGVRLHTAIYEPRCADAPCEPRPILLTRTPYGVHPYGPDRFPDTLGPSPLLDDGRFVVVHQDVRGRFMSEGEWIEVRPIDAAGRGPRATDESTDSWDTIAWLLSHVPRTTGRVGTWGVSYPGFYAAAGLVDAHPALVASSPQAPVIDYGGGDDAYHNGALMLLANFGFYASFYPRTGGPTTDSGWTPFDFGTEDGYAFFLGMGPLSQANRKYLHGRNAYWNEVVAHPDYDAYWKARAVAPRIGEVRTSVMTVGGWYDAEDLHGPLRLHARLRETSPRSVNRLVMGPWTHGGWTSGTGRRVGGIGLGSDTSTHYRADVERVFFEEALQGPGAAREPAAYVFDTGRHEWRAFDAWPPRGVSAASVYLAAGGRLDVRAPGERKAFDEYVSDPARPVPFVASVPTRVPSAWMTEDQRFVETRQDVLVYRGEPLAGDLTAAGPIGVTLHVSTTGTDADFVVKVIDEYPPGGDMGLHGRFSRLVRGEPFRARYRRARDRPEPLRPGVPDAVTFTMPDVFHTFRRGHRIVVHVQSSWFPLVDLNPQTFVRIPDAEPSDFKVATQRIYREAGRESRVTLRVWEAGAGSR